MTKLQDMAWRGHDGRACHYEYKFTVTPFIQPSQGSPFFLMTTRGIVGLMTGSSNSGMAR